MTTVTLPRPSARPGHSAAGEPRSVLLVCGIYSALLYAAMLVFVPAQWEGYSSASQTISELSAIGAPTRPLWITLGLFYTGLVIAFGWGVRLSAGRSRPLRLAGALIVASGAVGLFWPPMHLRGTAPTLTDTLHIVFAVAWNLLAVLTIVLAAAGLGRRFRAGSMATLALFLVFGTLTGLDGPRIAANLPTPWVGVWERVLVGTFLLWVVVLAVALLRGSAERPAGPPARDGSRESARPARGTGAGPGKPAAMAEAGGEVTSARAGGHA